MQTQTHFQSMLTTREAAQELRTAEQTMRKNFCLQGHHHGLRPVKQASGRLLWRASEVAALLSGGGAK